MTTYLSPHEGVKTHGSAERVESHKARRMARMFTNRMMPIPFDQSEIVLITSLMALLWNWTRIKRVLCEPVLPRHPIPATWAVCCKRHTSGPCLSCEWACCMRSNSSTTSTVNNQDLHSIKILPRYDKKLLVS